MAVTGFWPVKGRLKAVLDYADNPDKTTAPEYLDEDLYAALRYAENDNKTGKKMYVGGINCSKQNAYAEMLAVQKRFGNRGTVVAYHGIQSFDTGEVTPEEAFEIGKETARRMWGDRYQVLVIILNTSEREIRTKKDVIWFYQISRDKNTNINSTIELIEKYRPSTEKTIRIITFSSGATSELLLDSIDKGEIRVKLVDEVKYSCYALLDQNPIFEGAKNNKISALIVGCDYTGMEMLKAVIWCGQLSGYKLEINIIDSCANAREKEFARNCPDVNLEKYGIRFIEANVNSVDFKAVLDKYCQDTTYAIIAMGSDSLNISTAGFLRKYFLRNDRKEFQNIPQIALRVREGSKCLQMETLSRNNSELYGMTIFGSNEKMFSISNIMSSPLEKWQ